MTPRRVCWLFVPLFLGCAGKNVVAGEEKTKAQQLAALAPSWCKATCDFMYTCAASRGCECAPGAACDCLFVDGSCEAKCEERLSPYSVGSDRCAEIGQRFVSCVDTMTCDELAASSVARCQTTGAEDARCPLPDSIDDSPSSPSAGGEAAGPSSGGAASTGGSFTAGTASTAGSFAIGGSYAFGGDSSGGSSLGSNVSCSSSTGTAGSAFGGGPSTLTCEVSRQYCSDGHDYSWICARGSQKQIGCTCFVDGQVTGGFAPGVDDCPKLALVNAGCGWGLAE